MTEKAIPTEAETKDAKLRAAYGAAAKRLREENLDRFNELRAEESKRLGVDWKPRPSAEQKAEAELEALLSAHPNLADKLADRLLLTDTAEGSPSVPQSANLAAGGTGPQ